jgi:hypothetical protein
MQISKSKQKKSQSCVPLSNCTAQSKVFGEFLYHQQAVLLLFPPLLPLLHRSCLITVDFATATSQNSVCITQQIYHIMILLQDCVLKMKEIKKKLYLCHFLNNIGFQMKGKLISTESFFQQLENPPLCSSTAAAEAFPFGPPVLC